MALETTPFDAASFFDTIEAQNELLSEAIKSGEAGYIAKALDVIARARGTPAVAGQSGSTCQAVNEQVVRGAASDAD